MILPFNIFQVAACQEALGEPRIGSSGYLAGRMASRKPVIAPTPFQRSVAVGTLLGDSYMTKRYALQIEHATQQAGYVEWKHSVFANVAGKISDVRRTHSRTGVESTSKRFYTNRSFQDLEPLFYRVEGKRRKKRVPPDARNMLDATALAVWYMDDGGKAQNTPKGAYINVTGFTEPERIVLRDAINDRFGLKAKLHSAGGNNQWNIYVPAESYDAFMEIVSPTVSQIPGILYKIGR